MRASVIIPAWNGWAFLPACLDALFAQIEADDEVIVVDNASRDETANGVSACYPQARLIRNARNLGFSGACNVGLRAARGETLILLNQDTEVQPGWLAALLQAFDADAQVGIVGCKALFPDGRRIQHAGGWVDWPLGYGRHYGYGEPDEARWNKPCEVEFVTGAAMGLRRSVVEEIGLFDEGFWPGYFEDTDYCRRARAAGFRVTYCPSAILLHHESPSTEPLTRSRFYQRGRLRFVLKHLPPARFLSEFVPAELAMQHDAMRWGHESQPLQLAYLEALLDVADIARTCWQAEADTIADLVQALQHLHEQAVHMDRQVLEEKAAVGLSLTDAEPGQLLFPPLTAADLLPEYARQVKARRSGQAASEMPWLDFKEYQFRSMVPIVGPLIARLRTFWLNIAARWALLYLMQQQEAINRRNEEYLRALSQRLENLADENRLLASRLASLHAKRDAQEKM